ncbi:MAG: DEAD/DEAH box helicase family protein [Rikenellaceae bacterium]
MKLKFKHQKFQADAASAICDIFAGQPKIERQKYRKDTGIEQEQNIQMTMETDGISFGTKKISETGFNNAEIHISDTQILDNLKRIQRNSNNIAPSSDIEKAVVQVTNDRTKKKEKVTMKYNFTVEMETGTGKTYTYIKTMYELNQKYGWTKFIIVVPSVAIREGVYSSFKITSEHFAEEYGKKIRYFVYKSTNLTDIDNFASDSGINVMIINSQAFNAKGKDARRIYMKLDSFRSRRPIDIISKTNPIVIIDEPQSVEGEKTKERLTEFKPLFTLRYSATHKEPYNMVYRLDALEAYNKKLVKKIAVKGISATGSTGTEGYLYLQQIVLSKNKSPQAMLEYETKGASGHRKVVRKVGVGYNLYEHSGNLEQYQGFTVAEIDGRTDTLTFTNGISVRSGDVFGSVSEEQIRRLQIRETILSHLEKEKELFYKGIKVISLFFIDEVAKYRLYDNDGKALLGEYAAMFEEEYNEIISTFQTEIDKDDYYKYLEKIKTSKTHKGYFSIDKNKKTGKEKFIDGKVDRKTASSDDSDAYDLIMKDKERLLSLSEPVRFIFSHSALREGWDNPNVFQICTLKKLSSSDIRSRQEIGRGLRLSVNNQGERMDVNMLGAEVQMINKLTVITDYEFTAYVKALQEGIADVVADRPKEITVSLFENKVIEDASGTKVVIDHNLATDIYEELIAEGYVRKGKLTDKFYEDKDSGSLSLAEEVKDYAESVISILDTIYNPEAFKIDNDRDSTVTASINDDNFSKAEFKALWKKINKKTAYIVDFDENELIQKSIVSLNKNLRVSQIYFKVAYGEMDQISSKNALSSGEAFKIDEAKTSKASIRANSSVKYDLIGKIIAETGLTRANTVKILQGIEPAVFSQFSQNPEEFIIKAASLINEQKATVIIEHITYNMLDDEYGETVFTEPTLKGKLGVNAMETDKRHIYDYLIYDSKVELEMASELEVREEVCVYAKIPKGFFINTPVGKYSPDWAIAFKQGAVKHIYFVAETKGDMSTLQLKKAEELKKNCAMEHFKAISSDTVKYEIVDSYENLLKIVR